MIFGQKLDIPANVQKSLLALIVTEVIGDGALLKRRINEDYETQLTQNSKFRSHEESEMSQSESDDPVLMYLLKTLKFKSTKRLRQIYVTFQKT